LSVNFKAKNHVKNIEKKNLYGSPLL
jgi:hypothetical protein